MATMYQSTGQAKFLYTARTEIIMVIPKKLTVGPNRRQTGLLQESLALGKCSRQLHLYQSDFETNNDDTGQAEGRKAEYS